MRTPNALPIGHAPIPPAMGALIESTAEQMRELDGEEIFLPDEEHMISGSELAKRLGVSTPTVFIHIKSGTIPSIKRDGRRLILESVADAIVEMRKLHGKGWAEEFRKANDGGYELADESEEPSGEESEVAEVFIAATDLKHRAERLMKQGRFEAAAHFYELFVEQYRF